ncbi:MAG: monovalent cation:proton antiporter-2 (CPA2) family protein, partial [Gemmatimonadota bacterium]|nr:monovalent cation:proton antiporter-2 (CPA2) family protein [Gemmatimonadota bacterium]
MHGGDFFFQAFVYLAAAVISVPIAKRLGLGSVLGYLIAGVAIGPFALGLVGEEGQDVMQFAEFGVVMMLFLVGLELQPRLVWRLRGPILGLGGLQVTATAVAAAAIAMFAGFDWRIGVAVGLILAMSSTAIVLQTLQEKGLMRTEGGQNAFSVLLFQDLAVIPILAVLPLLAVATGDGHAGDSSHETATWIGGLPGWGRGLAVLGAVLAIVVGGRFLMRPVFRFIAQVRLREVFTAAALLLVIGIALLMTQVGLSPALGTFVAGVVLAESEYRHELEGDIEPFKGLLLGLFFIAVGASIDFRLIGADPGRIAALVFGLVALKFAVLFALGRAFGMGLDQNLLLAFALAQGGEFAFVLFSFASQNGVLPADVTASLVAVVALSMALTPVLMLVNERLVQPRYGTRESTRRPADAVDERHRVIIAGFGRFGNTIGRLLRANGVGTTVLDFDSDRVELLRRLGLQVFYGDATRLDLLRAAGAEEAELLILALDEAEEMRKLVETARKHFPHLTILARAFDRPDAFDLMEAGVQRVYRDTLDTALRVGVDALRLLGHRAHQATRAAARFRRHDEDALRELMAARHDRA